MYAGGHPLQFVEEVVNPDVPYLLGSLGPDRYAQLLLGGGGRLLLT
jgi:hypothetical protein